MGYKITHISNKKLQLTVAVVYFVHATGLCFVCSADVCVLGLNHIHTTNLYYNNVFTFVIETGNVVDNVAATADISLMKSELLVS